MNTRQLLDQGRLLYQSGDFAAAERLYAQAVEADPNHAEAHWRWSLTLLIAGDFERGWQESEWRLKLPGCTQMPAIVVPRWDGAPLDGRSILLHADQGMGDTIQFARFATRIKRPDTRVYLSCHKGLVQLFESIAGMEAIIGEGASIPVTDYHAPLLSLPAILGLNESGLATAGPYLSADSELVDRWRQKLSAIGGRKIGICWQGGPTIEYDKERSFPLVSFAPLADLPDISLISLQKGYGSEQLQQTSLPVIDFGDNLDGRGGFADTAAIMQSLDLVISADTAIAHLAGALGRKVWLALPSAPDWRWLLKRTDSPWYPTMRLFRQDKPGDWQPVFQSMVAALRSEL